MICFFIYNFLKVSQIGKILHCNNKYKKSGMTCEDLRNYKSKLGNSCKCENN